MHSLGVVDKYYLKKRHILEMTTGIISDIDVSMYLSNNLLLIGVAPDGFF